MRRPMVFVLLAGLAAMFASVMGYSALKRREAEVQNAMSHNVEVVVAAMDLPLGTKIEPGEVKLARWSADSLPDGAYTDSKQVLGSYRKNCVGFQRADRADEALHRGQDGGRNAAADSVRDARGVGSGGRGQRCRRLRSAAYASRRAGRDHWGRIRRQGVFESDFAERRSARGRAGSRTEKRRAGNCESRHA